MFRLNEKVTAKQPFHYIINNNFKSKINNWFNLTNHKEGRFIIYRAESEFKLRYALELKYNIIHNPLGEIDEVVFVATEETKQINDSRRADLFFIMLKHKFATIETITQLSLESLDILVESKDPALEKAAMDGLQKASSTLSAIMKKMIKYIRMPEEPTQIERETISKRWLETNIKTIVGSLNIAPETIQIRWNDTPDFPMITDGMYSILFELIENAIKFSNSTNPNIFLSVSSNGKQVTMELANRGSVIPQEELLRIWDRFYQIDPDITGQVKGIGLGMSIVKYFVNLAGGSVEIVSFEGGTKVIMQFPIN